MGAKAGALPGLRGDDVANQGFGGPLFVLEIKGKVIKKGQLEWRGGLGAEVAGGVDEGGAGEVHPDSVGPDPGGKGVAIVGEAMGKFEASASLGEVLFFLAEDAEEGTGDGFALGPGIPSFVNAGIEGFGLFPDDHGAGKRMWGVGLEFDDGPDEFTKFLPLGLVDLFVDFSGEIEVEEVCRDFVFGNAGLDVLVNCPGFFVPLGAVGNGGRFLRGLRDNGEFPGDAGAIEDSIKGVVVSGGDGVGLVVVAAGAGDREAHCGAGGDIDAVGDDEVVLATLIGPANGEESEGSKFFTRQVHEIGCDLAMEKLIIGEGLVECPNDPVAVGVGVGVIFTFGIGGSAGVGVAGDVKPVAGPAFTESGACEEIIDKVAQPIAPGVSEPGFTFVPGWKEAGQDMVGSTDQDFARGLRGWGELCFLEVGVDQFIDVAIIGDGHFEGPVFFGGGGLFRARRIGKCEQSSAQNHEN